MLKFNENKKTGDVTVDRIGIDRPNFMSYDNTAWNTLKRQIFGYADRKLWAGFEDWDDDKIEAFESCTNYKDENASDEAFLFAIGLGWYSKKADGVDGQKDYPETMAGLLSDMIEYSKRYKADEEWDACRKQDFTDIKKRLVDWFEVFFAGNIKEGYKLHISSDRLNDTLSKLYTQTANNGGKALRRGIIWKQANREQAFKQVALLYCACFGMVNYPKAKKQTYARNF